MSGIFGRKCELKMFMFGLVAIGCSLATGRSAHALAPGKLCKAAQAELIVVADIKSAVAAGEDVNGDCVSRDGRQRFSPLALVVNPRAGSHLENTEAARFLIEQGANADYVNMWTVGHNPNYKKLYRSNLAQIAAFADVRVLQAFLDRRPNLDFRAPEARTPLGEATIFKQWDNARLLIGAGANRYDVYHDRSLSGRDVVAATALSLALEMGAPLAFKRELLAGWNFKNDPLDLSRVYLSYEFMSPTGTLQFARTLMSLGANLHTLCTTYSGWDPAASCNEEALRAFVEGGGHFAPSEGMEMIRYLVSLGFGVNGKDGELLGIAIGAADWAGLTLLELGAKADVFFPNNPLDGPGGETPLTQAAAAGKTELVKALAAHGAIINDRRTSYTPLTAAVNEYVLSRNNDDTIAELIRLGADVNQSDLHGRSALCMAVHSGDANPVGRQDPIVALLLDHGAVLDKNCR